MITKHGKLGQSSLNGKLPHWNFFENNDKNCSHADCSIYRFLKPSYLLLPMHVLLTINSSNIHFYGSSRNKIGNNGHILSLIRIIKKAKERARKRVRVKKSIGHSVELMKSQLLYSTHPLMRIHGVVFITLVSFYKIGLHLLIFQDDHEITVHLVSIGWILQKGECRN